MGIELRYTALVILLLLLLLLLISFSLFFLLILPLFLECGDLIKLRLVICFDVLLSAANRLERRRGGASLVA